MATKFGRKNPLLKCSTLMGSNVMQRLDGSTHSGISYEHQTWKEEPLTEVKCVDEVKGHAG